MDLDDDELKATRILNKVTKTKKTTKIIERRKINVSYCKNGRGYKTTRISIPSAYFEKIGITKNNTESMVTLYSNKIVIERF